MRMKPAITVAGAILLTALLAACGNNHSIYNTTPKGPGSIESNFGTAFATIFDASTTSQPVVPTSASAPPLTPAAQPVTFPTSTAS